MVFPYLRAFPLAAPVSPTIKNMLGSPVTLAQMDGLNEYVYVTIKYLYLSEVAEMFTNCKHSHHWTNQDGCMITE